MKDKLLKVKDMLMQLESVNYQIGYGDALKVTGEYEIAGREEIRAESIALLDSIISMLDSPELVEKIGMSLAVYKPKMSNAEIGISYNLGRHVYDDIAKAAIESIRDKDNG